MVLTDLQVKFNAWDQANLDLRELTSELNQNIEQRDDEIRELTSKIENLTSDFTDKLAKSS